MGPMAKSLPTDKTLYPNFDPRFDLFSRNWLQDIFLAANGNAISDIFAVTTFDKKKY